MTRGTLADFSLDRPTQIFMDGEDNEDAECERGRTHNHMEGDRPRHPKRPDDEKSNTNCVDRKISETPGQVDSIEH